MFPDALTVTIKKEGPLYIGTVKELPNVFAAEETYREAWEIIQDAICTLREWSQETKK